MQNEFGQEVPDPTPVVIRFKGAVISQFDQVRAFIRNELAANRAGSGAESFEEANDFDVEDDLFPVGGHEYDEDTELADREVIQRGDPRVKPGAGGVPPVSPPVAGGAAPPAPLQDALPGVPKPSA